MIEKEIKRILKSNSVFMKNFRNVQIDVGKIISNEELKNLKGGDMPMGRGFECQCMCWRGSGIQLGILFNETDWCAPACAYAWSQVYPDATGYVWHCDIWV
jgi:hypothetical protein